MKYTSVEHRILRYFGKMDGYITVAHLKCLKPQGNDYKALVEIENRRKSGEDVSEIIPHTDAEFDMEKVAQLFHERFGDDRVTFDDTISVLKTSGYIDPQKSVATRKCKDKHREIETARKAKMVEIGMTEEALARGVRPSSKKLKELKDLEFTL